MTLTRRRLVSGLLAAPLAAAPAARRRLILNYEQYGLIEQKFSGTKLLLDGREVKKVWYVDVEKGFVKSYDIYQDGRFPKMPTAAEVIEALKDSRIEQQKRGLLSITLTGHVSILGPDGKRLI